MHSTHTSVRRHARTAHCCGGAPAALRSPRLTQPSRGHRQHSVQVAAEAEGQHTTTRQLYTTDNRLLHIATPTPASASAAAAPDAQPAAGAAGVDAAPRRSLGDQAWPQKSSLFLFRTDGKSCSRELVTGTGRFQFAHPSTQQHLLVWRDRPQVVMVIKKLGRELDAEFLDVVSYLVEGERMRVVVEPHMYEAAAAAGLPLAHLYTFAPGEAGRLADLVDFVVCLGGDGVILHASSLFKRAIPPVVSFHLGSMGFLTNHNFATYRQELRQVIYGYQKLATCSMDSADLPPNSNHLGVMITLRMRLQCSIVRAGQAAPEQVYEVLNEIVVDRGSNSFLTNIEAYINGRFITRVQADGIMLATPTGSTAYSVAAGGSMVHPNVQAILLTPICPHSLNFRPIVLPDYTEMELRVPDSARVSAWVCFDGKQRQELHRGDSVFIKMSENPVPTINRTDLTTDWFESLERCFRWSNRPEQKPFQDDWVPSAAQGGGGGSSSSSSSASASSSSSRSSSSSSVSSVGSVAANGNSSSSNSSHSGGAPAGLLQPQQRNGQQLHVRAPQQHADAPLQQPGLTQQQQQQQQQQAARAGHGVGIEEPQTPPAVAAAASAAAATAAAVPAAPSSSVGGGGSTSSSTHT